MKLSINDLLDTLLNDPEVQRQWELNSGLWQVQYSLTDSQMRALLDGNVMD